MSYLVDTNILLRLVQQNHSMHADALRALLLLRKQSAELCLVPQNLIEFWAVATRPLVNNGLGLTVDEATREMWRLKRLFNLRADAPAIFSAWEKLVAQYQVLGKQTHDARIVAAMQVHQLTHLLTFNTDDFKRYHGITVIDPRHVR